MPSPIVVSESDVVNVFRNLEVELRGIIRRQLRGTPYREEAARIGVEIVTLIQTLWDNAPSLRHWWFLMQGEDLSTVPLNDLYDRLGDLGVDVDKVLRAIARVRFRGRCSAGSRLAARLHGSPGSGSSSWVTSMETGSPTLSPV